MTIDRLYGVSRWKTIGRRCNWISVDCIMYVVIMRLARGRSYAVSASTAIILLRIDDVIEQTRTVVHVLRKHEFVVAQVPAVHQYSWRKPSTNDETTPDSWPMLMLADRTPVVLNVWSRILFMSGFRGYTSGCGSSTFCNRIPGKRLLQ